VLIGRRRSGARSILLRSRIVAMREYAERSRGPGSGRLEQPGRAVSALVHIAPPSRPGDEITARRHPVTITPGVSKSRRPLHDRDTWRIGPNLRDSSVLGICRPPQDRDPPATGDQWGAPRSGPACGQVPRHLVGSRREDVLAVPGERNCFVANRRGSLGSSASGTRRDGSPRRQRSRRIMRPPSFRRPRGPGSSVRSEHAFPSMHAL
jgi:hypothetical protein